MSKVLQWVIYAVAIVLAGLGYRLVMLRYAQDTIEHTITDYSEKQQALQHRQLEQLAAQAKQMTAAEAGRTLAPNERCIDGSIVRVEIVNGVPTYTQASDGSRPVMCPMR